MLKQEAHKAAWRKVWVHPRPVRKCGVGTAPVANESTALVLVPEPQETVPPFHPIPRAQSWYIRAAKQALTAAGFVDLMEHADVATGFYAIHGKLEVWNSVTVAYLQDGREARPRKGSAGAAAWDEALAKIAAALTDAGFTDVWKNKLAVHGSLPAPERAQTVARVSKRVWPESARTVTFEGWPQAGESIVNFVSAGMGEGFYAVQDHEGTNPVNRFKSQRDGVEFLADWYGLAFPVQVIEDGGEEKAAPESPAGPAPVEDDQADDERAPLKDCGYFPDRCAHAWPCRRPVPVAVGPNRKQQTAEAAPVKPKLPEVGKDETVRLFKANHWIVTTAEGRDFNVFYRADRQPEPFTAFSHLGPYVGMGMTFAAVMGCVREHSVNAQDQFAQREQETVRRENARRAAAAQIGAKPVQRLVVVPCGDAKADVTSAPAGELYVGSYHKAARKAAAKLTEGGGQVVILSAKYGLVTLDQEIETYDLRAGDAGTVEGATLREQARALKATDARVTVLGGAAYVELARTVWPDAEAPLSGGMGKHMQQLAAMAQPEA